MIAMPGPCRWFSCRLAVFLGVTVLLGGCGKSDIGHVEGKVTLGGQPITEGSVVFADAARGISLNATLNPDGTFHLRTYNRDGLPAGKYQVAISLSTFSPEPTPLVTKPTVQPAPVSAIPEKYRSVTSSGLSAEVRPGKNPPFCFELKRDGS